MMNSASATPIKYSCLKCKVVLSDRASLSQHYRSQWHRHNLAEASRGFMTIEESHFNDLLNKHLAEEKAKAELDNLHFECSVCSKIFHSEGTFNSHLQSNKHKEGVIKVKGTVEGVQTKLIRSVGSDSFSGDSEDSQEEDWEDMSSDEETNKFPEKMLLRYSIEEVAEGVGEEMLSRCFLCCHRSDSPAHNLGHLSQRHGFRLQYREFLLDELRVLAYISAKVLVRRECLKCERTFSSVASCQRHMLSAGHASLSPSRHLNFYKLPVTEMYAKVCLEQFSEQLSVCVGRGRTIWHRELKPYFRQSLRSDVVPRPKRSVPQLAIAAANCAEKIAAKRDNRRNASQVKLSVKANKLQTHFRCQVTNAG